MLTTVASLDAPLMVTFTLSPALNWVAAGVVAAGDVTGAAVAAGLAAAGVAAGLFSLLLFAFSDSQAVKANARTATAKIFIVMIVLPKYASDRSVVQFRR